MSPTRPRPLLALLVVATALAAPACEPPAGATPGATHPGALPLPPAVQKAIAEKRARMPAGYRPRTRHLTADGKARFTNRLFLETSPYLLQHAHNPVNWFPWGDEAFALAKKLGRPVLLSVGYSTCHWCHVMEEESFEDLEVARLLNENYIAIKVDREERPDVDAIYMEAVRALTRGGGWPMTVWLTPDREPFYGGTYFPPRPGMRGSRLAFIPLLKELKKRFDDDPTRVKTESKKLAAYIARALGGQAAAEEVPDDRALAAAYDLLTARYDEKNGGLTQPRKFPSTFPVRLMLRLARRQGDATGIEMVENTLVHMAAGGIHDHVGGGFHRYTVDARWRIPHFEKMLYDNARLAVAYLDAWQLTGRADFRDVVETTLDYVAREMTAPEGGFYSATDADSKNPAGESEEGWFFTWTPDEVQAVIGPKAKDALARVFELTPRGNHAGRNVLIRRPPIDAPLPPQVRASLKALYAARKTRPPPLLDDKILTADNGLMIQAFARAGRLLDVPAYIDRARAAASFLLAHHKAGERLLRTSRAGAPAKGTAFLDDYAFLIAGLLDLLEATGEIRWFDAAVALDRVLQEHYEDRAGGFFLTADDGEKLLAREKPSYDGAHPSGNAVQAMNLLRLHTLTGDDVYRRRADATLSAFGRRLGSAPSGMSEMLLALDFRHGDPKEIVLVGPDRASLKPLLDVARATFVSSCVLLAVDEKTAQAGASSIALLDGKIARGGKATAYVCKDRVCELPTSDPGVLRRLLEKPRAASPSP